MFADEMSLRKLNKTTLHFHLKWISRYKSTAPERVDRMKMFWEKEVMLKSNLQYDLLSEDDKKVHDLHEKAIRKGHFTYDDPKTNERIRTRLRHFLRGTCCGNACRHVSMLSRVAVRLRLSVSWLLLTNAFLILSNHFGTAT